MHTMPY